MNPRKLAGKLTAQAIRYDVARGGLPDITAQDFAAALGSIGDELAREMFCACWAPDMAILGRDTLDRVIAGQQSAELLRLCQAHQTKRLELHLVGESMARSRRIGDREIAFDTMRRDCDAARSAIWRGTDPTVYSLIRQAVVLEVGAQEQCRQCTGRGVWQGPGGLKVDCDKCQGTGRKRTSDVMRAERIGRDPKSYRETWRTAYEWTLRLCSDAEAFAVKEIIRHLTTEEYGEDTLEKLGA